MADNYPSGWEPASNEAIVATVPHPLKYQGKKAVHDADRLVAHVAAERIVEALQRSYTITPHQGSESYHRAVRAADINAFMGAADDLVAAQQAFVTQSLLEHGEAPTELRALTLSYLEMRAAVLHAKRRRVRPNLKSAMPLPTVF